MRNFDLVKACAPGGRLVHGADVSIAEDIAKEVALWIAHDMPRPFVADEPSGEWLRGWEAAIDTIKAAAGVR